MKEKIIATFGVLFLADLLIKGIRYIHKETETNVISDKGLAALQDPVKKKRIDDAIEAYRKDVKNGGMNNRVVMVDLS